MHDVVLERFLKRSAISQGHVWCMQADSATRARLAGWFMLDCELSRIPLVVVSNSIGCLPAERGMASAAVMEAFEAPLRTAGLLPHRPLCG